MWVTNREIPLKVENLLITRTVYQIFFSLEAGGYTCHKCSSKCMIFDFLLNLVNAAAVPTLNVACGVAGYYNGIMSSSH